MVSKQQADAIGNALTAPAKAKHAQRHLSRYPELAAYPPEQRSDRLRDALKAANGSWPVLGAFALALALAIASGFVFWLRVRVGPMLLCFLLIASLLLRTAYLAQIRKNLRAGVGSA